MIEQYLTSSPKKTLYYQGIIAKDFVNLYISIFINSTSHFICWVAVKKYNEISIVMFWISC
jgi:hypothetical protein